jgi:diguanylate cyclase (GGDEF)-like protein
VITDASRAADGTVARHAGAEDHLIRDATLSTLLPRAVRYAVGLQQVRRELATVDEATKLPNLRGFAAIGEHYLRTADRMGQPAVFVFVRLDDHDDLLRMEGPEVADELARDAAAVILEAVRDSDLPARIAPDTICVLLTGSAEGAESLVLSRLVEAIATHDARRERPRALSLGVGTARYEPGTGTTLAEILESAVRGLSTHRTG